MSLEFLTSLENNNCLKEKLLVLENLLNQEDYNEAYKELSYLLYYINMKYIKAKFDIDKQNLSIINMVDIYMYKDEYLYKSMLIVNSEYNEVDINDVTFDDIEFLADLLDSMYEHMLNNVGEFIL